MKNALFLCPSPYNVTYHRALPIASHFIEKCNYSVDLLCTGDTNSNKIIQNVNVIQSSHWGPSLLPLRGWNPGEVFNRLKFVFQNKKKYDLIYSFEYQPNVMLIAAPLVKYFKAKHFNDWCDWYAGRHHKMKNIKLLQKIDSFLEEYPRRHVDCVTTICNSLYERALSSGVPKEKLLLIREGSDPYHPIMTKKEARESLGIHEETFLIVSIVDQGIDILRDAINLLNSKRSSAKLVLIGKHERVGNPTENILTPGRVSDEELHRWLCANIIR